LPKKSAIKNEIIGIKILLTREKSANALNIL